MSKKAMNKGFTLVELIIGIVVLAVAMMVMNTMLISQSKDALEPLYRLRASQLGQSIMQNILTRAYDQNADHNGGYYRCGEIWGEAGLWYNGSTWQSGVPDPINDVLSCTTPANYGPDGAHPNGEKPDPANTNAQKHPIFNDVDDFITTGFIDAVTYGNVVGEGLSPQYNNYAVQIAVSADSSSGTTMKRIDVTIKTPSDEEIVFSALKGNY